MLHPTNDQFKIQSVKVRSVPVHYIGHLKVVATVYLGSGQVKYLGYLIGARLAYGKIFQKYNIEFDKKTYINN